MKSILLVLTLLPVAAAGQHQWQSPYQQKGDSIVTFFLGEEIFQRYVKFDGAKSQVHSGSAKTSFFHYNFRHPKFSGRTLMIRFMLDSVGQFMANDEAYGLVRIGHTVDSSWVTGLSALKICKGQTLCDSVGLIGRGVRSPYDAY